MSYVEIDMPEFNRYIKLMNKIVNELCVSNKTFANKIIELEESGWRDDVYKEARNQLLRMQTPTNEFISILEELDERLISWYCALYEEYVKSSYSRPVIDMGRVEKISDAVKKQDEHYRVSVETLESYVQSTTAYTTSIRDLLTEFFQHHRNFAEYFHSRRYEEITDALQKPKNAMVAILNEMDGLAAFVKSKVDIIRKFQ